MTDIEYSESLIQNIFDSLSAHIAIIDEQGRILATNAAWRQFSDTEGGSTDNESYKGVNYLTVCDSATEDGDGDARNVAQGIRDVIEKKCKEFLYDYPCHSPAGKRWFYMRAIRMDDGGGAPRIIVSHEDITELKLAQEALKNHQETLEEQNQSLEEANIALKVLIKQRDADKADLEKKFLTHIRTFVLPYIKKLKKENQGARFKTLVDIIEGQLNEVITPLMKQLSNADVMLTPQEMQVAALVKDGKTTAEIADILYITEATVSFHRRNLRTKLGLKNKRSNLRSFLLSMS